MIQQTVGKVMVVGGGVGGVQAALDLADSGYKVYIVEEKSSIGGVMAQLDKTFPTNDCSMCILSPKLVEAGRHPNIEIVTLGEVQGVEGDPGNLTVQVNRKARFVDGSKCTGCGTCTEHCPVKYEIYTEPTRVIPVEIADEDRAKVDPIIARHRDKKGPLMPVLKDINRTFKYLPQNVLRYISLEMQLPLSLIYRVVTFYNAFSLEPRGKHLISICKGTACHVRGAPLLINEVSRVIDIEPGQTTDDGLFTVECVSCLGACAIGPVVVVDGVYYEHMTPAKLRNVIENLRQEEEVVTGE